MAKPASQEGDPAAKKRRPLIVRRLMFGHLPRWKCWCYRAAVGLPLVAVLALVVLTQTVLLKRMVLPPLEKQLGLRINAAWVYVGPTGDLVMQNVQVLAPGVQGPAAKVLQVGGLRAD